MIYSNELSIIVTGQNIEPYLLDCLISIDGNGGEGCELIVVDDGSSDETCNIAKLYLSKRNHSKFVETDNLGPGGARNAGIAASAANFIMFVDGDDLLVDNAVSKLTKHMSPTQDILFSNRARFFEEDGRLEPMLRFEDQTERHISSLIECLSSMAIHGRIFNKSFLEANNLKFEEKIFWEDIIFTQQAYAAANMVSSIGDVTYWWRKRSRGGPSVMQLNHTVFSIISRMRQIDLSMKTLSSAEWQDRFKRGASIEAEFTKRLLPHIESVSKRSFRGADNENAIQVLIDVTEPYIEIIRKSCKKPVVDCYEALWAKDIRRLRIALKARHALLRADASV
jgi:CDP-glycerol glycerophosphotransferase